MRHRWSAIVSAFLLGGLVMAAVPVVAGNGDPMYVGTKNNARRVTKLIGRHGLEIRASKSEALKLYTQPGVPPMMVTQDAWVWNLNADYVDGMDAAQLKSDATWVSNDDISDSINWSSTTKEVTVPTGGGEILMAGSVDFYNSKTSSDWVECFFKVDDSPASLGPSTLPASSMRVYAQPSEWATCSTTAAVSKSAGTYTVQFYTAGASVSTIELDNGSWWALGVGN